jgi:hypothetical protein
MMGGNVRASEARIVAKQKIESNPLTDQEIMRLKMMTGVLLIDGGRIRADMHRIVQSKSSTS